jgi:hypothetical protein
MVYNHKSKRINSVPKSVYFLFFHLSEFRHDLLFIPELDFTRDIPFQVYGT